MTTSSRLRLGSWYYTHDLTKSLLCYRENWKRIPLYQLPCSAMDCLVSRRAVPAAVGLSSWVYNSAVALFLLLNPPFHFSTHKN